MANDMDAIVYGASNMSKSQSFLQIIDALIKIQQTFPFVTNIEQNFKFSLLEEH
jgi:hypothetical protein